MLEDLKAVLQYESDFHQGTSPKSALHRQHFVMLNYASFCCNLRLDIHRLWSQESINCPIVRDLHRKKAEETASQLENETLSIVVSKPVDEKREAEPTREMSETASTISRGVSVHSTDSFDSADDWDDDDDDDNILDMDLVSSAVYLPDTVSLFWPPSCLQVCLAIPLSLPPSVCPSDHLSQYNVCQSTICSCSRLQTSLALTQLLLILLMLTKTTKIYVTCH